MPVVPTYDTPTVAPAPLPGAQVSSIASPELLNTGKDASDIGSAAESFGQDLTRIQTDIQTRQNADLLFRAEAGLKGAAAQFTLDSQQRKGVNAWDLTKQANQWWDDNTAKFAEGLDNPAQKQAYDRTVTALRSQNIITLSTHEALERQASLEESGKASIVGSINNAAANYGVAGAVPDAIDNITRRSAALAQMNGWTPERRDLETENYLTSLHKNVLQNMVQDNPDNAQAYFDQYKEQINGTERDGVEKIIKGAKFTSTAQGFVDTAMAANSSQSDMLAAARNQFSGQERDQVVQEIDSRFHEDRVAREGMQSDAADQAYRILAGNGFRISGVPQALWQKLDGKVQLAIQQEGKAKADGASVKTDPTTFYGLRTMAAQDPDQFTSIDLRAYKGKLSEPAFEQFVDMQQSVKQPKNIPEVVSLDRQLSDAHQAFGWANGDEKKKGTFDQYVTGQLDGEQRAKGKPLTYTERQAVIDRAGLESSSLFSSTRYYEVANTPAASKFAPTISDADRAAVVSRMKARGIANPTSDQVLAAFKLWKGL